MKQIHLGLKHTLKMKRHQKERGAARGATFHLVLGKQDKKKAQAKEGRIVSAIKMSLVAAGYCLEIPLLPAVLIVS